MPASLTWMEIGIMISIFAIRFAGLFLWDIPDG
jgi:hypothetical protein